MWNRRGEVDPVDTMAKRVWAMVLGAYIMAGYGATQALTIIFGGPARFSAPGYTTSMEVPGAPQTWGAILLPLAVLAICGVRAGWYRTVVAAMFGMGAWSFFFAMSFARSAATLPDANLTAINAYGKDALLYLLLAVAYRVHRKAPVSTTQQMVEQIQEAGRGD